MPIKNIGVRHGEKDHEVLVTREEMARAKERDNYYIIPADYRDLNYDRITSGNQIISQTHEYSSANTKRLNKEELLVLLRKMDEGGLCEEC